eukprot:CAMPEP_0194367258 /NCGR_PEP_ID=MMETSP0174-20130528/15301_1 /TAXON_ID=216777 /ORGANISM="Proboscia alata, Strain PI-D3" /LENGTH=401 /DNA_ID=CAMNT_0039142875 /DNA_START=12 /DNA_END=1214 /DNA_ORIENTATION=+
MYQSSHDYHPQKQKHREDHLEKYEHQQPQSSKHQSSAFYNPFLDDSDMKQKRRNPNRSCGVPLVQDDGTVQILPAQSSRKSKNESSRHHSHHSSSRSKKSTTSHRHDHHALKTQSHAQSSQEKHHFHPHNHQHMQQNQHYKEQMHSYEETTRYEPREDDKARSKKHQHRGHSLQHTNSNINKEPRRRSHSHKNTIMEAEEYNYHVDDSRRSKNDHHVRHHVAESSKKKLRNKHKTGEESYYHSSNMSIAEISRLTTSIGGDTSSSDSSTCSAVDDVEMDLEDKQHRHEEGARAKKNISNTSALSPSRYEKEQQNLDIIRHSSSLVDDDIQSEEMQSVQQAGELTSPTSPVAGAFTEANGINSFTFLPIAGCEVLRMSPVGKKNEVPYNKPNRGSSKGEHHL